MLPSMEFTVELQEQKWKN